MTQRQLLLHYAAQQRLRKRARAELLVDVNQALSGGKNAADYLKTLTSER